MYISILMIIARRRRGYKRVLGPGGKEGEGVPARVAGVGVKKFHNLLAHPRLGELHSQAAEPKGTRGREANPVFCRPEVTHLQPVGRARHCLCVRQCLALKHGGRCSPWIVNLKFWLQAAVELAS